MLRRLAGCTWLTAHRRNKLIQSRAQEKNSRAYSSGRNNAPFYFLKILAGDRIVGIELDRPFQMCPGGRAA
jgi:hypothetical protein